MSLAGTTGVFVGMGDIVGGVLFGLLGSRIERRIGRSSIIAFGLVCGLAAYWAALSNLPSASLAARSSAAPLLGDGHSRQWIVLLGGFLLGIADAAYQTQLPALVKALYPNESAAAFAIVKFCSSASSTLTLFLAVYINLPIVVALLAIVGLLALAGFIGAERLLLLQPPAASQGCRCAGCEEAERLLSGGASVLCAQSDDESVCCDCECCLEEYRIRSPSHM